jgi:hypothetical protein
VEEWNNGLILKLISEGVFPNIPAFQCSNIPGLTYFNIPYFNGGSDGIRKRFTKGKREGEKGQTFCP